MKGWKRNMVLLIDTNILLDVCLKREPFLQMSRDALLAATNNNDNLYFPASSVTDIFYFLRKDKYNRETIIKYLLHITKRVKLVKVDSDIIFKSFASNINDLEDAVIDEVADSVHADYILTRDKKGFSNGKTKAISPSEFLEEYSK